jgi:hypothetical protein
MVRDRTLFGGAVASYVLERAGFSPVDLPPEFFVGAFVLVLMWASLNDDSPAPEGEG